MTTQATPGPLETLSLALDELDAMHELAPHVRYGLEQAQRRAFGLDPTTGARERDRLIAAASQMREALERAVHLVGHFPPCGRPHCAGCDARMQMRAALHSAGQST